MKAMVLRDGRARRSRRSSCPIPSRARARCCSACAPAASAAPTCTSSTASSPRPKLPLVLGHQIVGEVVAAQDASLPATASACRGSAGRAASCRYCRAGRENLCDARALHRLRPRRRLRRARVADERFCFPIPDGYADLAGRAAALRRADRLPLAAARGRRRRGSASTASAPPRTSSARSRVHAGPARSSRSRAPGDARGAGVRALARRRVGRRHGERPPEELDAAIIFAPAGELVPAALGRVAQGRRRRLRRHPHERHPVVPVRAALGRARRALGREPHARRRRGVPRARAAGAGADGGRGVPARPRRTRRSSACARATCAARSSSSRDR